uniref:RING-type E3 ubiquitin transferase n=1 Tax=Heterorhabditis bacteriophora TaxID=37862 RepID=A0A1I7XNM9_HETBA
MMTIAPQALLVLLAHILVVTLLRKYSNGTTFIEDEPIAIDENVCLRLTEVATNWSGVLRFGVTNVDPETYRNIAVPKFACPDLTSKEGYWAKALPERYSVEGNILHFYVSSTGELCYGINGTQKGVFLVGINTSMPLWIIVDIYGNSVAVEFIDPSDFRPPRNGRSLSNIPRISSISNPTHEPVIDSSGMLQPVIACGINGSSSLDTLRFHQMTGRHVSLNAMRNIATRCEQEYTQGYVFTERPIRNNEKVVIQAKFEKDSAGARTVLHVDNTLPLYVYFDLYGSTQSIRLLGTTPVSRSHSPMPTVVSTAPTRVALPPVPTNIRRPNIDAPTSRLSPSRRPEIPTSGTPLRVLLRDQASPVTNRCTPEDEDASRRSRPALPPRRVQEEFGLRRTVDELLIGPPITPSVVMSSSAASLPRPPPVAPRPNLSTSALSSLLPTPPARPPPPAPISSSSATSGPPSLLLIPTPPSFPAPHPPSSSHENSPRPQSSLQTISAAARATSVSKDANPGGEEEDDECTVCMSAVINSVIYTCGHMCMCYDCASQTLHSTGLCPLCRSPIKDVIKFYRS